MQEPKKRGRPAKAGETPKKRPGIMKAALAFAEAASPEEPLTWRKLYELLCEKFPEHAQSMRNTAKRFENWAEYYYKVRIHKNAKGFWLRRDYRGDFQKAPAPAKRRKR